VISHLRPLLLPLLLVATPVSGQPVDYTPITPSERVQWVIVGTVGPKSLFVVGPLSAGWQTAWNQPEEWRRSWGGFGKRYLQREADVAISNTLEAGVGALWGEEPRYIRQGSGGVRRRALWAIKTAFVTQRRDGRLHPACGRYVSNTVDNVIENTWLPPSATTAGQTIGRSATAFATRIGGNVFEEFWPDIWRRLRKRD